MFNVAIRCPNGAIEELQSDKMPDTCPRCLYGMQPIFIIGAFKDVIADYQPRGGHLNFNVFELIFQCPREPCHGLFIARYKQHQHSAERTLEFTGHCEPLSFSEVKFDEPIKNISPMFCQVYNEAARAHSLELLNVAGSGYRKALEFLIKDFAIKEYPAKDADIKKALLGQVIEEYIKDGNILACAKRAAWLGNDETHYERRWNDKDITDLINLIGFTQNWIKTLLGTREYLKSMSEGKK